MYLSYWKVFLHFPQSRCLITWQFWFVTTTTVEEILAAQPQASFYTYQQLHQQCCSSRLTGTMANKEGYLVISRKKVWITYGIPNIHTKFCSLAWSWNLRVWQFFSHGKHPHILQCIWGVDLIKSSAVHWNVVLLLREIYFCISLLISILPTHNLLLPILL